MLKILILLVPLMLVLPTCSAQEISNPEAVSYLHAEVTRSGSLYLFDSTPLQAAKDLVVTLTVPQNSSRQKAHIKSMEGADRYQLAEDMWGNKIVKLYWV
jgi:hypothetical protein